MVSRYPDWVSRQQFLILGLQAAESQESRLTEHDGE